MRIRLQRGATLVIALIMLVLLTLFAISALNTSTTNLKVVGNMQTRNEAFNAAQQGIDNVVSRTEFYLNGTDAVIVNKCGGLANTLCIDKDGKVTTVLADAYYTTKISGAPFNLDKPSCIKVTPIRTTELNYKSADDQPCFLGTKQQFGTAGVAAGDSLCAQAVYQITAETTAVATNTKVATVTQGIGIRISTDIMDTFCVD